MGVWGPAVLVRSPHAGRTGKQDPVALLESFGLPVARDVDVPALDGMEGIGREWHERGYGIVVVAGGDGAIGWAAKPVVESGLPLGILPAGTANDIARSLDLPLEPVAAAAVLSGGKAAAIDAGQAIALDAGASVVEAERLGARRADTDRLFLHLVAIGMKVEFARLATDPRFRKRWGRFTYPLSFVWALRRGRAFPVTVRLAPVDGEGAPCEVRCRALQVAVANTPVLGGALSLRLPGVTEGDRLLDVFVVEAPEWLGVRAVISHFWYTARKLTSRWLGAHDANDSHEERSSGNPPALLPHVRRYATRAVVIETPVPRDVTLDGEICMRTPLLVRIAERPVSILLPIGSRHGRHMGAARQDEAGQSQAKSQAT